MITIAVQAGGKSSRMGEDKALIHLGGIPLIERVLTRIDGLADEILITTNRPKTLAHLNLRMVGDEVPGAGALHGLKTALSAARGEVVLILSCDTPFVSRELLEHLLDRAHEADVIVPKHGDKYEPLQAVYNRARCLPAVEAALVSGERRMVSFYPQVRVLPIEEHVLSKLDPSGLSFFNVNTAEDLERAEQLLI
ncbi:MAG: molybdenum cofactor guanylyltransferase [Anaerolineales bacterium]|nr:MAG: molybdenum cofactor guanylyltransferase [Anaerolineales bacterium]